jgi:hypothetical protein
MDLIGDYIKRKKRPDEDQYEQPLLRRNLRRYVRRR